MSFSEEFSSIPIDALVQQATDTSNKSVERILNQGKALNLRDFAALISPAASNYLEPLAVQSQKITQQYFGKVIRLFAPLYLSNECINICKYCGFSRNNTIPRITLPIEQVVKESNLLAKQGFRNLLLVAGEHPKFVSNGYVEECIKKCLPVMPAISLELGPLETEAYRPMVEAGCEGLIVYQETYHEETYKDLHIAGPKKRYDWRMDTPERAYQAGFRKIGIGALLGLYDWRYEIISVAAHARYMLQNCWKAQLTISIPRMRPATGGFQPKSEYLMNDRQMVQSIAALRMLLPHAGIVVSTREVPDFRDGLVKLGITHMSAGACTEPGGYSEFDEENWCSADKEQDGEQFHIADERTPQQFADMIRQQGYEPVWKDFDQSFVSKTTP